MVDTQDMIFIIAHHSTSEVFPAHSLCGSSTQCIQMGWHGCTINNQPVAGTGFYSQESVTTPSSFMDENPWDWPLDPWRLRMLCHVRQLYTWMIQETSEDDVQDSSFTGTNSFMIFTRATFQNGWFRCSKSTREGYCAWADIFGCVVGL